MTDSKICDYCGKEHGNAVVLGRNSGGRHVNVEKANERVWGLFMRWRTPNGKWRMEWNHVNFCPMCGRDLREVRDDR